MTYRELQEVLQRLDSAVGAAEAHGWLCGALCIREGFGAADWLAEIANDAPGAAAELPALRELHAETQDALRSPDFAFAPLLPAEQAPLAERVAALAGWCGGFLYGIGAAGANDAAAKTGDVGEILEDLAEISRVELEAGRAADAGEADYAELQEFVRAGAQLAFEELAALRAAPARRQGVH
ncbi:MAG TPA: UPF0149 family protein [Steroidobacteraceae bacterium]|nr:UPF0149 family protein [Steroidobacteraceae bacterium]